MPDLNALRLEVGCAAMAASEKYSREPEASIELTAALVVYLVGRIIELEYQYNDHEATDRVAAGPMLEVIRRQHEATKDSLT